MEVVHAVRGDRQIGRLGQARDLQPDRNAAAVGQIGLGEGHAARRDQRLKLVQGVQVLAGRDRQAALAHDAGMARDVVGDGRLLEPDTSCPASARAARIA